MKRRFTAKAKDGAEFSDRAGNVVRIHAICVEFAPAEGTGEAGGTSKEGGDGVGVEQPEQRSLIREESSQPTERGTGRTKSQRVASEDIDGVIAHYGEVMEPRGGVESLLKDQQARKIVADALKVAEAWECKRAIDGCKASPFHMGDNDRRKKYNRIGQILKGRPQRQETTRDRINYFLDVAEKAGVESGFTSVPPAVLSQHKRAIFDAFEFPNDEGAQRRGEESEAWLNEHGWEVDRSQGRPTFRRKDGDDR